MIDSEVVSLIKVSRICTTERDIGAIVAMVIDEGSYAGYETVVDASGSQLACLTWCIC